jgi:hypothetical protein
MLASTVQFSNNNQPPATPAHNRAEFTGTSTQETTTPAPSRPHTSHPHHPPPTTGEDSRTSRPEPEKRHTCPHSQTPNSALTGPPAHTRTLSTTTTPPEGSTADSTQAAGPHQQTEQSTFHP